MFPNLPATNGAHVLRANTIATSGDGVIISAEENLPHVRFSQFRLRVGDAFGMQAGSHRMRDVFSSGNVFKIAGTIVQFVTAFVVHMVAERPETEERSSHEDMNRDCPIPVDGSDAELHSPIAFFVYPSGQETAAAWAGMEATYIAIGGDFVKWCELWEMHRSPLDIFNMHSHILANQLVKGES